MVRLGRRNLILKLGEAVFLLYPLALCKCARSVQILAPPPRLFADKHTRSPADFVAIMMFTYNLQRKDGLCTV